MRDFKGFRTDLKKDEKKEFEKALPENDKTVADYENQTAKIAEAKRIIQANNMAIKEFQGRSHRGA